MSKRVWAVVTIGAAVLLFLAVLFAPILAAGLAIIYIIVLAVVYNRQKK